MIQYAYDPIGNMTMKAETATGLDGYNPMTYGAGAAGPHALTSVTPFSGPAHAFEYDANGNMTNEYVDAVLLTSYGYNAEGLTSLRYSSGADTVYYTYDHDGALTKKRRTVPGPEETTVYIGGIYEKNLLTGEETKYYYAGGQRIAMRKGASLLPRWIGATHHGVCGSRVPVREPVGQVTPCGVYRMLKWNS